ncbi:PspA/IM30 family protein [Alkalibacterium pelagium]|jgi:phage shock protein A|uniref:Phage shock protein A (PspA) family protein n=1 Tax=Alkalibacterium pelagium TaxID=426702 RepID=A0A1H7IJB1_9LACT|nr:PspA/IM30 family protein [Alkalibacterium pelagium]GEN50111.1 phage shock protein A [Alkalibacterium pelagium]SEK62601.1 phage shock protein A (PspA) family protein [Alkalibacterium pelagium]
MAILDRFSDIISANVNALIDRMEDPEKMIDQYLRKMMDDLAEVKQNTASVMAEETRAKRLVDENEAEVVKYGNFAKKALEAGNDDDARVFLSKKQELEDVGTGLANAYAKAHENASKMRQMHDKLATDIEKMRQRRAMIKAQLSVADTQDKLNKASESAGKSKGAMSSFERMEEKASRRLDESNAMADLNKEHKDEAQTLEEKYASESGSAAVEDELARMKKEMGLSSSDED